MAFESVPSRSQRSFAALEASFPDAPKSELQRFALARPDPKKAIDMYADYVQWRSAEGRPDSLARAFSSVPSQFMSGVNGQGPAKDGTCTICIEIARYDTKAAAEGTYVLALCHLMDEAVPPETDGQVTLILECRPANGAPNPTPYDLMPFAREAAKVLPSKYPERMRCALIYPVPWMANVFVSAVKRLMDPSTREKLVTVAGDDKSVEVPAEELIKHISIDSIPRRWWYRSKGLDPAKAATAMELTRPAQYTNGNNIGSSRDHSPHRASDEEEYYSASEGEDGEDIPLVKATQLATPRSIGATSKQLAPTGGPRRVSNGSQRNGDANGLKSLCIEDDLEAGPVLIGKEEHKYLMDLLAEARERQKCCWWLPCRCHFCGHRSRHRL